MNHSGGGAGLSRGSKAAPSDSAAVQAESSTTGNAKDEHSQAMQQRAPGMASGQQNGHVGGTAAGSAMMAAGYKPLNVKDALSYLDQVREERYSSGRFILSCYLMTAGQAPVS